MSTSPFGFKESARFQPRTAVGYIPPAEATPVAAPSSDWMDDVVAFLFSPKGRVSRRAYRLSRLGFIAVYFGIYYAVQAIAPGIKAAAASPAADASSLLYILAEILVLTLTYLVVFASGVMLTVKRWHDIDKSGWWALIGFVPILGVAAQLIVFAFVRGTPGANRYGLPPTRK